ncbi:MAG: hypothetical protein Q9216_002152 [Gyalolechia sp. 2 TL-2023]
MACVSAGFPGFPPNVVSFYCTRDPLVEDLPVLVFYGPSTTSNATRSSTRIQAHVYSVAGFQSFPRLTIAPTSPLYAAVNHLPSDKQGDEVCRGLAVSLLSYFAGLSKPAKDIIRELAARRRPNGVAPAMFDEMHAGELAAGMVKIDDGDGMIRRLLSALSQQSLSWIDVDVVLPPNSIQRAMTQEGVNLVPAFGDDGLPLYHYGDYDSIVSRLGKPTFLPTSKLRRAPSRPTGHSKSRTLLKQQKIALRREMCELLDTEKSYVAKLHTLVNEAAADFRQSVHADTEGKDSQLRRNAVSQLFPESLDRILAANSDFLSELEDALSATQDEAIQDIESLTEEVANLQFGHASTISRKRDPTGTLTFAKLLLDWLPKFSGPYQDYMRVSASLPDAVSVARNDPTSNLFHTLNEFGEQRLRSILIEPVQRLPRYSLLLDNMISQLPVSHAAMSSLLKSKDVLADICAFEDGGSAGKARTSSTLRKLIDRWPAWLSPRGRLITAVDAVEVEPPYSETSSGLDVILLLFPDTFITVRKRNPNVLSAKAVLAEVDRSVVAPFQDTLDEPSLLFGTAFDISKIRLSESADSCTVRITHAVAVTSYLQSGPAITNKAPAGVDVKVLILRGSYEGKAYRLSEEVVKARFEGRFSEPIRESDKWALRTIESIPGSPAFVAAIYEDSAISKIDAIKTPCRLRVSVGSQDDLGRILSETSSVDVAAQINLTGPSTCKLTVQGIEGSRWSETFAVEDLGRVFAQRVTHVLSSQGQLQTQASALANISYNREVLRALPISRISGRAEGRSSRPLSPIKLVSNLFSGSNTQTDTPSKWRDQALKIKDVPPIPPPKAYDQNTGRGLDPSLEDKVTLVEAKHDDVLNPFEGLELTFNAYIIALQSRSGNVVGRILRNRAAADELAINELYNTLIEDPSRIQAAAEVSIDVLFSAFEKFLARAWQERMGSLLPPEVLETMISGLDSGRPTEFAQRFRKSLDDMSPQNRRAFSAAMKLLSDLLDASGNDGDRGALMASFAEALVSSSNPHDGIMLFDRLVDDYDSLFDDTCITNTGATPGTSSVSDPLDRNRTTNTGSLSSNASSLKKRFGFGSLSRENSKSESESKVASVWRTLSKNAKSPGDSQHQPASLSKGSLIRSRSTDTDPKMLPQLRPSSQDRPIPPNASPHEGSNLRPTSSHLNMSVLTTIGENTPTKTPSVLRKKRRSSLSDLKSVQQPPSVSAWQPLQPRKLPQPVPNRGTPPQTPNDSKPSARQNHNVNYSQRLLSPERFGYPRNGSPERFGSPPQKENSLSTPGSPEKRSSPSIPRYTYKKPPIVKEANGVTIKNLSPRKRTPSSTEIPVPRNGLAERAWPPNATAKNASPTKTTLPSPQKLRMQSPQKLRERLSNEQKALSGAESSLRAEMAKIGEEMSAYKKLSPPHQKASIEPSPSSGIFSSLTVRLDTLSTALGTLTSDLQSQYSTLSKDVESSLVVSERKARKLDDLYREANAENEALYERFNDELGKVLRGVKGGGGAEELRRKIQEGEDEMGRLRKENGRLKREVVGLRSQLSGS